MFLTQPQLISLFHNEVGLEDHVQRHHDSEIGEQSDVAELEGSDPLQNPSIFVDDLTLLEVEVLVGVLAGHFDKRLVGEGRVIDVLLEFQQSVEGGSKELRVSKSI
jgi:hypothetical protein